MTDENMEYIRQQNKWMESIGVDEETIKGKKFIVKRVVANEERGWRYMNSGMAVHGRKLNMIGGVYVCDGLQGTGGREGLKILRLSGMPRTANYFPFFVLEPAWDTGPDELMIGVM